MQIIKEKQDLTYLSWTKIRNSSGTAGSFLKSYSELEGGKKYYKLSNYDSYDGIVGHECVNEIIVDRLLSILGIDHLEYKLIHADILINGEKHTTYLCESKDFKRQGESKLALDAYYQSERLQGESPLAFCERNGWRKYISQMLLVDFLILNRDRHGANIEVLRNSQRRELRLAPLFDHGLSLLFQCRKDEDAKCIDVMEDKRIQCFVGSNSARNNLKLIRQEDLLDVNVLYENDRTVLMDGLDGILSEQLQEQIWQMIYRRWRYYEDFCNSGCK